jgi:hypothetical protein
MPITDLTDVVFTMIHSDAAILLDTKATSAQWLRVIDEYIDYTRHLHRCDGSLVIASIRHTMLQEIADLSQDLIAEKIIDQAAILSIAKSFDSTVTTKERLKQLIRTDYKYNVLAALSMTLPGVPEKVMDLKNSIKEFESYLKEMFAAIDKGELLYSGKKIAEKYSSRWQLSNVKRKPIAIVVLLVSSDPGRNESFLSEFQEESLCMLLYATKLRMEVYKQRIGSPAASVADLIDAKLIETEPLNPLTTQRLEIDKNSQPRWTIAKAPALDVTIDKRWIVNR